MPGYSYVCDECHCVFNTTHGINETPAYRCPECGATPMKRIIAGGTTFVLKGKGWYRDGY